MKQAAFFTDLDGTIINRDKQISEKDIIALQKINSFYYTIAITGRNILSFKKVLKNDYPFDYVVFSNGAGIYDFKNRSVIYKQNFEKRLLKPIISLLLEENVNFFVQYPIPDNHYCEYVRRYPQQDFERKIELYKEYSKPLNLSQLPLEASELIIILDNEKEFFRLKNKLAVFDITLIRSTSPIDNKSIWLEIFHKDVSKAKTAVRLCKNLGIEISKCVALGNDYNDKDLLDSVGKSFVVRNSTISSSDYTIVSDNNNSPIAYLLERKLLGY